MTKIARLIALWAVAGCALPVSAYQMEVVGPDGTPSAAQGRTAITQPAPVRSATSGHTASRARVYGPTKASETLWSIASRVRPSNRVSVQQTIGALYRLNPSAFELDNLHGLKPGSRLRLPTLSQVRAENTATVNARLEREKPAWERYSREKQARERAQAQKTQDKKTAARSNPVAPSVSKPLATPHVAGSNSPENRASTISAANTPSAASSAKKIAAVAATAGVATAAVQAATAEPDLITPLPANSPVAPAAPAVTPSVKAPASPASTNTAPVSNVAERYAALENVPVPADTPASVPAAVTSGTSLASSAPLAQQAQPIVPLAVSAGMLANTEQKEAQALPLTAEEAKQLRQQLVDSATEISRLTENNVSLTNQVSELQIRVKQLQVELDNEAAFRKEASQAMAHAEEQAKALELERMKNKMLEESSGSLIQQMSRSWPLAIGVGVIPPVLLGALLWLLYRVRQRRQNALLSQAFEEHQPKDFGGAAAFALGNDTPDLSRPDDMEMPWEDTDTSEHPAENSAPAAIELPEPPSLFASLPGLDDDDTPEDDDEALLNSRRRDTKSEQINEDDFDLAHPTGSTSSAPESAELASLVDLDLAHDEMLGGDEIVDVILSTPSLVNGSPLDQDDDIRLLADMDDEDPILSLSDEDLFESLSPAAKAAPVATAEKSQSAVAPEPEQTKKPEPETEPAVAAPASSAPDNTAPAQPHGADKPPVSAQAIAASALAASVAASAAVKPVEAQSVEVKSVKTIPSAPVPSAVDDEIANADKADVAASPKPQAAAQAPEQAAAPAGAPREPEPVAPGVAAMQPEGAAEPNLSETDTAADRALEIPAAPTYTADDLSVTEIASDEHSTEHSPEHRTEYNAEPELLPVAAKSSAAEIAGLFDLADDSDLQLASPVAASDEPAPTFAQTRLPEPQLLAPEMLETDLLGTELLADESAAGGMDTQPDAQSATSTLSEPVADDTELPTEMSSAEAAAEPVEVADMQDMPDMASEPDSESEPFRSETERALAAALAGARQRAPQTPEPQTPEVSETVPASASALSAPMGDTTASVHSASLNPLHDELDAAAQTARLSDYRAHDSLLTPEEQKQLFAEQLLDLPEMTEADFDLSAPMSAPADEWRMPLPPEPASADEDWAAQDNLMDAAVQVTPEERDAFTQSFVEAEAQETEADDDLVGKLILARAYLDIDDPEGAQPLLESVLKQGSAEQQAQARKMLQEMA
ncbi:FimV/HubP family polar landmark protein [Plesiomonas shigelloides]|uniref:FimV/HubP family polar landmark protein n=1 Tax=Plesiomonas shigelloides TaxID=703 RepID=UPI002885FF5C|nr:FimV/HubP family polar landmark protein [Plesiomonas shigelloides]MDT1011044.1 FimV/HubP family polar landmark protein [Plesiomonas shigelloides]